MNKDIFLIDLVALVVAFVYHEDRPFFVQFEESRIEENFDSFVNEISRRFNAIFLRAT